MAAAASRWIKPEVYPLFACVGGATVLSFFALGRKVIADPGISLSKATRADALADDPKAGKAYKLNFVRRAVADQSHEIMPAFNRWLSGVK